MIFLLILFALLWPVSIQATPELSANLSITSTSVGSSFEIGFSVVNSGITFPYYVKAFGGIDGSNSYVQTYNSAWLNYTGDSWSKFPSYTSDLGSSLSGSIIARVNPDKSVGNYNIYLKICEKNNTDSCTSLSSPMILSVSSTIPISDTPTPSPTATPSPTSIPTTIPNSTLTINSSPSTLKIGQNYTVTFTINNAIISHDYTVKAYGGVNDNFGIENQSSQDWLNYNSAWTSYPKFNAVSSTISTSFNIRVKDDEPTGQASLKFKMKDQTTDNESSESNATTVTILAPDPTSTPTASPTPSPKTTPSPKLTPSPTQEPSPTEQPLPTEIIIAPTTSGQIEGISDIYVARPTPSTPKKSAPPAIIPIIFITLGAVLLCVPLIIAKLKR